MASVLSSAIDICLTSHNSHSKKHNFYSISRQSRTKSFTISCNSSNPTETLEEEPLTTKTPSFATTIKSEQTNVLSNPKSVWINPSKPRRSVLSLQRHKSSSYSYNPQFQDLKDFTQKLNSFEFKEKTDFLALLDEIPHPLNRDNALLILNSLRQWQKTHLFFYWMKTQNLFPIETLFYNVTMKSLRFGRQFQLIEELAFEMERDGVKLDNFTYSTIISCAKRCNLYDKAIEWFERMYKTGLIPDEVTYSTVIDLYAKLGMVEDVLSVYERAVATGWKPNPLTFSILGKMFGEDGDYNGIRYVVQEMKSMNVNPTVTVYNTLMESMGKVKKPWMAKSLFNEMIKSGLTPNEITLTVLIKIYGKAKWEKDALRLWNEIKAKNWPMDLILCNTLLNMCADIGLEEEAETLFNDMKQSRRIKPDSFSYTAMLNVYGNRGKVEKAMELIEEMIKVGVELNVMGSTCLIESFGKSRRINDLVDVFNLSIKHGVKADDRLCECLLSVMILFETNEDFDKIMGCLEEANLKLASFVKLIIDEKIGFEKIKEEFRVMISETKVESRKPFCNCLIDICRRKNRHERAHQLLYLGTLFGLYPRLYNKTVNEWSLDVRSLSFGTAETALEQWMSTLAKIVQRQEDLPERFLAKIGTGTRGFEKVSGPFRPCEDKIGCYVATREDLVVWLDSMVPHSVALEA